MTLSISDFRWSAHRLACTERHDTNVKRKSGVKKLKVIERVNILHSISEKMEYIRVEC